MAQASTAALIAALVLSGCHDRPPATGGSAGSAVAVGSAGSGSAGSAADPWASPPKPPDTPETRLKRAEAALARVADIEPAVAKLRQLSLDREVPRKYQSTADFQRFVRSELDKELPAAKSRDISAAMAHLGLLTAPIDLAQVMEQAMITQAGAYYDPKAKAFFLVMVPDSELLLDTISAHELTHALQDQHFDLGRFLPPDSKLDDDAVSARRFIAEGDATFVMLLYAARSLAPNGVVPPAMLKILHQQIESFSSLSIDALKDQTRAQANGFFAADPEFKTALDAMDKIPPAVLVPLYAAYMQGALVALTAYERGGWPAVDALFRDPPTSTEQVMHPATKLYPKRERPQQVQLAKPSDPALANNVIGELLWKVYFDLWKVPEPAIAADGWGGDRFDVVRRKDGRLIGRIATAWDSPAEAAQFATAYVASLAARFPGADVTHPAAGIARPDGGRVFVRSAGARVFIVDGADDASALDALVRTTRFH